jgi:KaiC/GvpD/RAD55 family RecA-like ATPase
MKKYEAPAVRTLGDLLSERFPERHHLVFPWLRQGESAMVWAEVGLGKTMFTMTLALMVAGGGTAFGWHNDTPRKVLIVDGEMAREDLQERAAMLMDTVEGIDREAAASNLAFMARTWQARDVDFPDLNDREQRAKGDGVCGQDAIVSAADRHGAAIVFLDNYSTLADVPDENDAAAMGPTLGFLMRLKSAQIACVLVHHSGKTGDTYRGSSRLATTFEVIMGLKRLSDTIGAEGAAFTLHWTKYRGAPHPEVRSKDIRLHQSPTGAVWCVDAAASDRGREMAEAIRSCRFVSQDDVAAHFGIAKSEVSKRKISAIKAGYITQSEVDDCFSEARRNADASEF